MLHRIFAYTDTPIIVHVTTLQNCNECTKYTAHDYVEVLKLHLLILRWCKVRRVN